MPWFSYHGGHSGEFCRHAKGQLKAVVDAAIARGFTHYGLSEHCPRDRAQDLYPGEEDLGPDGLSAVFEAYVREARRLRDAHADRIELLVGFETERLPPLTWASRMRQLRTQLDFDYLVGSVHDVDGVWVDFKPEMTQRLAAELGGIEALQRRYFEALVDLVTTLRPEVVGHFDLVRKFDGPSAGFSRDLWPDIERALDAVQAMGGVLDVNAGAHRRGLSPVYPLPEILSRARQMGIGVTLGDDSHGPHDIGVGLDACMKAIAQAGYTEMHYLARRDGRAQWLKAPLSEVRPRPASA